MGMVIERRRSSRYLINKSETRLQAATSQVEEKIGW
jgi:hypothetical protein